MACSANAMQELLGYGRVLKRFRDLAVTPTWGSQSWLDSVGINRRGVVNERVIQERSSDHPDPEPCEGSRKAALEALDRGICGLGIELRKRQSREPTVSAMPEGNRVVHDKRECAAPCGVEDPMHA